VVINIQAFLVILRQIYKAKTTYISACIDKTTLWLVGGGYIESFIPSVWY